MSQRSLVDRIRSQPQFWQAKSPVTYHTATFANPPIESLDETIRTYTIPRQHSPKSVSPSSPKSLRAAVDNVLRLVEPGKITSLTWIRIWNVLEQWVDCEQTDQQKAAMQPLLDATGFVDLDLSSHEMVRDKILEQFNIARERETMSTKLVIHALILGVETETVETLLKLSIESQTSAENDGYENHAEDTGDVHYM